MKLQLENTPQDQQNQETDETKKTFSPYSSDEIPVNEYSDLEEPTFRTTSTHTSFTPQKKSSLPGWIPPVCILAVLAVVLSIVLPKFFHKHEVSSLAGKTKEEVEQILDISLTENPSFVNKIGIPNQDTTGFQAYTTANNDFVCIYYNNQPYGISITNKKYTAFGIQIGDSESHLITAADSSHILGGESGAGYPFEHWSEFLNVGVTEYSSEYFFYGKDNSILVMHCNNTSHRVVNIQYYPDRTRYLKDVDSI